MSGFGPVPRVGTKITGGYGTVTLTAAELDTEVSATTDDNPNRAERILAVASRMCVDYAPTAPCEVLNEAVIRLGGYLAQSDYGTHRREKVGDVERELAINHAMMFRQSGAMGLLTRYKVRRAGVI